MKRNILIDLEFTGLDNSFINDNEIIQLKLMNADTGEAILRWYRSSKPVSIWHRVYCGLSGRYPGRSKFSAKQFDNVKAKLVGPEDDVQYFGYGVSQDKLMLSKYAIDISICDLQERIRLNPQYEAEMAIGCASMEAAYLLLTGRVPPTNTHLELAELQLVREIHNHVVGFENCNELLTVMPWGHCAGMPIGEFVAKFRRQADGYRYNNSDLLAKSLTNAIHAVGHSHSEDWDQGEYDLDDESDFDED